MLVLLAGVHGVAGARRWTAWRQGGRKRTGSTSISALVALGLLIYLLVALLKPEELG